MSTFRQGDETRKTRKIRAGKGTMYISPVIQCIGFQKNHSQTTQFLLMMTMK